MKTVLMTIGVLGILAGIYLLVSGDTNNGLFSAIGSGCLFYWVYGTPQKFVKKND